ncbi:RabGAP TBC [Coprinellus micaceus]|uniref:RabGAP TBC n=1 Tax=Coprinellus micaceus TaxID=71717 RepID=A0A4Y7SG86_COPMI|nr:RabGAP TBC [Coprinellus micaceus]
MEAHRNRELKWMNLLSTSVPSQARKSKKIRKLLLDGVPASVRYMVWSHLTDGKARFVPGVYPQLCKRGRVPASEVIEREVGRGSWFARDEQGQLRVLSDAGGGVVQLLQAYLNMVPDIQYTPGLPHIVGQLLLLAPEEDAFWIFISIMDTHIRPYFSSGSIQMEVDSALFSRALEVNDAQVAKKLLVDMGINPNAICQPWFTSLFVGCLPAEYLTRTWDLFLYDGIPFLFRVGLAIVSFVRRQLLNCTSEETALSLLHRPPPLTLPPSPENYLSFVYSIKLKDDDVKKQRIKMEAQVKRQTQQQPRGANTAGSISLPRV